MGSPEKEETETDPALGKPKVPPAKGGDQITNVIGEVGRWQLEKILIVFLAAAPGLAHIFHAGFITPKQRFWCSEVVNEDGMDVEPPWSVEYPKKNKTYLV